MIRSNIKAWGRHVGIMMLALVIVPNALFYSLAAIPDTVNYGLLVGTIYYGISYFLFDYWIVVLHGAFKSGVFAFLSPHKAEILAILICWTVVCIFIAVFQVVLARFLARRAAGRDAPG